MVTVNGLKNWFKTQRGLIEENLWANVYHDTIRDIEWLYDNNEGITPGYMAVGYNYLYVMTRILSEISPNNILDIGLGLSSTLFTKYYQWREKKSNLIELNHIVIEHDDSWVDFYTQKHKMSKCTVIEVCALEKGIHKGNQYWRYDSDVFGRAVKEHKFSIISIDGPFGYMIRDDGIAYQPQYVRRDVVEFIPSILTDDFVIVIDDYDTRGVKNTVNEIINKFKDINVKTYLGIYYGRTNICVIASEKYKFLSSV